MDCVVDCIGDGSVGLWMVDFELDVVVWFGFYLVDDFCYYFYCFVRVLFGSGFC